MRGRWWLSLVLVGALPSACGNGKSDPPAPLGAQSGGRSGIAQLGQGGSNAAGAPREVAGEAPGAAGEGGAALDLPPIGHIGGAPPATENGGAPPDLAPTCDPAASWSDPVALTGISTADADEHLLAMTHDELSLVFERADQLFVADRADAKADFGAPVAFALPDGYDAGLGMTLSPDGLALVIVNSSSSAFADITRSARSGAFDGAPDTARFVWVNDNAKNYGDISSPVLTASNDSLFYTQRMASSSLIFRARGKGYFSSTQMQDPVSLGADGGKAKLGRSISFDERALFIYDEALGNAVGLWSATVRAAFSKVVSFSGLDTVFTNRDCSRLYASRKVGASFDVVIETTK